VARAQVDAARTAAQTPDGDAALGERGGAGAAAGEAYYIY